MFQPRLYNPFIPIHYSGRINKQPFPTFNHHPRWRDWNIESYPSMAWPWSNAACILSANGRMRLKRGVSKKCKLVGWQLRHLAVGFTWYSTCFCSHQIKRTCQLLGIVRMFSCPLWGTVMTCNHILAAVVGLRLHHYTGWFTGIPTRYTNLCC